MMIKKDMPTAVRIPNELKLALQEKAKKEERSLSWIIIKIIREHFEKKIKQKQ